VAQHERAVPHAEAGEQELDDANPYRRGPTARQLESRADPDPGGKNEEESEPEESPEPLCMAAVVWGEDSQSHHSHGLSGDIPARWSSRRMLASPLVRAPHILRSCFALRLRLR
jgi:hypothetical protein